MTWQDAQAYCEDIGGDLVTITSQAEQDFVSHPQKTAQTRQIKLDEKRDSRQKALGLFCVLEGLRGEKQRSRDRGESLELVDVPGKYWWTKSGENKRI